MRSVCKYLLAAITAVVFSVGSVQAQEMTFFRIGTGGAGGTYFPIGGIIASAISNPPGARACEKGGQCGVPGLVAIAVSTTASVYNCNAIQNGDLEAGLTGGMTVYEAYNGFGKFQGKAMDKLRVIANLYPEDLHLVLQKGSSIGSIDDLRGKRVGIAQNGSGTQLAVLAILKKFGMTKDDIKPAALNNSQSADRLADGQLDAYFYAAGTPLSALIQLGSTKGFELHRFSEKEINDVLEVVPTYVQSLIPAGEYETITYDVPTVAVNGFLVTSADQAEDFIYEITKALWNKNSRRLLDNGHSKGKAIRLENALKGVKIPLHPGAERFYKEQGLI
ncbi:MAG TPA: TAXI family TRAP transporter solute-binding subunit [Gammaproteobacteria bacterium]|nr:TAXI family TRAP transporter solute-binding subunit [Gammaproteobacteria bacterium]